MGHVHIQNQEEHNLMPNSSITHKNQQQQKSIIIPSSSSSLLAQQENNDFFSMLNLNSPSSTLTRHQRRRNSAKRRALSSSSSSKQRSAKKHSSVQDNGFSAISLPISLGGNNAHVLRRCVSDLCQSSEQSTPMMTAKESGLPPLPPKLTRCMSADVKSGSRSLNTEDNTPDSMRLKRMKDRLREMKQWWDDVMKEEEEEEEEEGIEEEEEEQEEKEQSPVAEEDKGMSQDEFGEDIEEAVSVEWAEKCLSLTFKCPCGKGNEVWPPIGKKKFETLSYLPPLTREQLLKEVEYLLRKGWVPCLEFELEKGFVYRENHSSPGYYDGSYWTMWKLPLFGTTDASQVLKELDEVVKAYPSAFVRIIGFDNIRQVQCISFIAHTPETY